MASGSDVDESPRQHSDHKSAFVLGLAESQGTLAVVAALLAGFSYSAFCSVTRDEINQVGPLVQYTFVASTAMSASMALFVTIVCSLCEQQGRVARSFAVLRGFEPEFEDTIHGWWKSFAQIRTNAVFLFMYSIPVFFASIACIALIKLPPGPCCVAVGILLLAGTAVFQQLLLVNDLFRTWILRFFTSTTGFAAPSLDPEPSPHDTPASELRGGLGSVVLGTVKSWPSRKGVLTRAMTAPCLAATPRSGNGSSGFSDDGNDTEPCVPVLTNKEESYLHEPDERHDVSEASDMEDQETCKAARVTPRRATLGAEVPKGSILRHKISRLALPPREVLHSESSLPSRQNTPPRSDPPGSSRVVSPRRGSGRVVSPRRSSSPQKPAQSHRCCSLNFLSEICCLPLWKGRWSTPPQPQQRTHRRSSAYGYPEPRPPSADEFVQRLSARASTVRQGWRIVDAGESSMRHVQTSPASTTRLYSSRHSGRGLQMRRQVSAHSTESADLKEALRRSKLAVVHAAGM